MLSQDNAESEYEVTCHQGKSYTVIMEDRDLIFFNKNKLNVANIVDRVDKNELTRARKQLQSGKYAGRTDT